MNIEYNHESIMLCNYIGDIEYCTIQNSSLFQVKCFIMMQHEFRIQQTARKMLRSGSNSLANIHFLDSPCSSNGVVRCYMPTAAMAQVCVIASLMGTIALASPQYGHPLLSHFQMNPKLEAGQSKPRKLRSHHCHVSAQQAVVATILYNATAMTVAVQVQRQWWSLRPCGVTTTRWSSALTTGSVTMQATRCSEL